MSAIVTHDDWVQAALDAAVQQHGSVGVQDPDVLDAIADVFAHGNRNETTKTK